MQQQSEHELAQLRSAHNKQKRDADTVTDEMYMQVTPRPRPGPTAHPKPNPSLSPSLAPSTNPNPHLCPSLNPEP